MGSIIDQFGSEVKIKGEDGIIVFRGDECITCEMCVSECPEQAISLTDAGIEVGGMYEHKYSTFRLYVEKCTGCGECARVCPSEALTIENFGGGGGLENAGGLFGDYGDGTSNPPKSPSSENPCQGKTKVTSDAKNPKLKNNNDKIKEKTTPDGPEYGADQKLNSLNAGNFKETPVTTQNDKTRWSSDFSWNSTDGYWVGFSHSHPDGSAPSPSDVFELLNNLNHPDLKNAPAHEREFYRQNASLTGILPTGEQYVVRVANWGLLDKIFNERYQPNPDAFNQSYNSLSDYYKKQYESSEAEATEFGLKGKLGDSINLYKKRLKTPDFDPLELGPTPNNPKMPQPVQKKGC